MARRFVYDNTRGDISASALELNGVNMSAAYSEVQFALRGLFRGGSWTPACPDPSIKIEELLILTEFNDKESERFISNNLCQTAGNWYWFDYQEIEELVDENGLQVFPILSCFFPQKVEQFKSYRACTRSAVIGISAMQFSNGQADTILWDKAGAVDDTFFKGYLDDEVRHGTFFALWNDFNSRQIPSTGGSTSVDDPNPVDVSLFSPLNYTALWRIPGWSRTSCADLIPIGSFFSGSADYSSPFGLTAAGGSGIYPPDASKNKAYDNMNSDPTAITSVANLSNLSSITNSTTNRYFAFTTPFPCSWEINSDDPSNT